MPVFWSKQVIEKLKSLHAAGLSASQIAAEFGRDGIRVSRNAVIGKCHRLGLFKVSQPMPRKPRSNRPPRRVKVSTTAVRGTPVTMAGLLAHHCHAPLDGPTGAGQLFCGGISGKDCHGKSSSYCARHYALFYVPPKPPARRSMVRA